jgi:hypothetical protein
MVTAKAFENTNPIAERVQCRAKWGVVQKHTTKCQQTQTAYLLVGLLEVEVVFILDLVLVVALLVHVLARVTRRHPYDGTARKCERSMSGEVAG